METTQSTPDKYSTGKYSRFFLLYLLAPLLLILEIPVAIHIAQHPVTGISVHNLIVRMVEPNSPASDAGIISGDRIIAVNGDSVTTMVDYYTASAGHYDLSAQTYIIQRGDSFVSSTINPQRPSAKRMIRSYTLSIAGIAFLLMGWYVFAKRDDLVTKYFFVLCLLFAFFFMDIPDWPSLKWMTAKEISRDLAHLLLPVVFLRFLLYFPTRSHLTKENRYKHKLLWIPFFPLFLASIIAQFSNKDPSSSILVATIQGLSTIYLLGYCLFGLFIFSKKAITKKRGITHYKMRSVLLGLAAGIIPFLIGNIVYMINPEGGFPAQEWLGLSLVLIPVSFGIAILRQGALEIDFVVRHGLVYLFLSIIITLTFLIIIILFGHTLTQYFNISNYPIAMMAIALIALTVIPLHQKLHKLIENIFYPARKATRKAIEEICHEISGMVETSDSASIILNKLYELYKPEHISIFNKTENFILESILKDGDINQNRNHELPSDSTLSRVLMTARRPIHIDEIDGLDTEPFTDEKTLELQNALSPEIIIPLVVSQRLRGFITMGKKSSGSEYTQNDISNLHFLSIQVAALLELQSIYHQHIKQKQLETELSVAKNIQTQLVPDSVLETDELILCGSMSSCREVGGDYFDYFINSNGTIGFAIADAVGKGIPAALIMTTLRVAFRSAAASHSQPEKVVSKMNQTISDLASINQFVCFFYGIFNPEDNTIRYANAGMNPPMYFRNDCNWPEQLKKGGLVLGIDKEQNYAHGTIHTNTNDTILLYTDGLTEEIDQNENMFGSERLASLAIAHCHLPPNQLRDKIITEIDDFSGGQQSDDRTLIVLRVK